MSGLNLLVSKMDKKVLILLIGIFLISNVLALGVSPGRTTIDFKSNLEKVVNYEIVNPEGKDMEFSLSVDGELASYVDLGPRAISIGSAEERKSFSYTLKLPSNLEPGTRTGRIVITEIPKESSTGESYVAATLAVATQIYVNVPFSGKYATSGMVVYNTQPGEDVMFVFPVTNKGKFELTSVRVSVDVYNKANEKVGSFNTQSISIPSGERKEIVYNWANNLSIGEYRASAIVIYDEGSVNVERIFSIGDKELELRDIVVDDFSLGEIVKMEMLVENKWSEPIGDAYIETKILNDNEDVVSSFRSSAYDLEALAKEVFVSYWDTDGVTPGSYAADVAIYYLDKVSRKSLQFDVSENDLTIIGLGYVVSSDGGSGDNSLVTILIIAIVILVMINLLWFMVFRKRIGGKK